MAPFWGVVDFGPCSYALCTTLKKDSEKKSKQIFLFRGSASLFYSVKERHFFWEDPPPPPPVACFSVAVARRTETDAAGSCEDKAPQRVWC
jgi:hypothetical protein